MSAAPDIAARHAIASDARLPDVVQAAIFPDEKIIWIQRGRGWRWPLIYTAAPVFFAGGVALVIWLVARYNPPLLGVAIFGLLFVAPLWAISFLRPIFAPPYEHYVLTEKRLLHCTDLITRSTWSLVHNHNFGSDDLPITSITVWGTHDRGWIMLRSDINIRRGFQMFGHPSGLVGVGHPLKVAALIKSTLNLPFEIEDHTR